MELKMLSPDRHSAADIVRWLNLQPLDREGGFFRRTAEAATILPGTKRRAWSAIYMLITPDGFSALHRLQQDETWCFHAGDTIESLRLRPDGFRGWVRLGLNLSAGEHPQDVVTAQTWQGTRLLAGGRWALVSCVVAPEFWWEDFEIGDRARLVAEFPEFAVEIQTLTREIPPAGAK